MFNFPRWKIIFALAICLISVFYALPNILSEKTRADLSGWLPSSAMNLGLDLRGGSYLLLQVDFDAYLDEQLQFLIDDLRIRLRKERIGYRDLAIKQLQENRGISFDMRDQVDFDKADSLLSDLSRDMHINVDKTTGNVTMYYRDNILKEMMHAIVNQSIEIVRRRVDETGTREPIIQRQGDLRILLQVPGLDNPEHLKSLLGRTAKMTFHLMDENEPFPTQPRHAPAGTKLLKGDDSEKSAYYLIKKKVVLSGDLLVDSKPSFQDGRPVITFRFNTQGGRKFAQITSENVNKPFAIVLDDKVITAPVINEPITGGSGIISGNFTVQSANDLALLLRAGALPAPLKILEERTVGPSLGQDSIEAGKNAALIGAVFVIITMILFYGLFGVFSSIAMVMNMIMVVAVLSLFGASLTLPGIAGLVLTMGMAVDANVLIFERIREEIAIGRTPFAAIDQGFKQAFVTIFDSNITTLIATLLLFIYGSGSVKGFAVALSAGIICSMFSAILLTRIMIVIWLGKTRPATLSI